MSAEGQVLPPDPWAGYETEDPQPWVDPNGNRHTLRTRKFPVPQAYLDAGCTWAPRPVETRRSL